MRALLALTRLSLKLNFRNRMAILYGYLFPLIFLIAFRTLYRGEPAPLILHLGQFLTITILGGACFGLPTTIVGERERGVWRRYRLLPGRGWIFITSVLVARVVLLASAALLQLVLAFALGMPWPLHPGAVLLAFAAVTAAFMALGLVIAMLVDNVPAVQALGQCIFLPMLIVGGVAVPLESLPDWAQGLSAFFPGRYAVAALQSSATGTGRMGFDIAALVLIALAAGATAAAMFRWDKTFTPNRAWLLLALGMWVAVGGWSLSRPAAPVLHDTAAIMAPARFASRPMARDLTGVGDGQIDSIAYGRLPPDDGIIAPVARPDQEPDAEIRPQLDRIQRALPGWAPGNDADPVQRARNLLAAAAVPDILQMEQVERFVPRLVFARLQTVIPPRDLPRILYWIALHPQEGDGAVFQKLDALGLPNVSGPQEKVRGRVMLYAFKLLGRLSGHITPTVLR